MKDDVKTRPILVRRSPLPSPSYTHLLAVGFICHPPCKLVFLNIGFVDITRLAFYVIPFMVLSCFSNVLFEVSISGLIVS
jgi:hypothetical protein